MMLSSLPVFWRLQETPAFGSAFIKSVKSVAAFKGAKQLQCGKPSSNSKKCAAGYAIQTAFPGTPWKTRNRLLNIEQ